MLLAYQIYSAIKQKEINLQQQAAVKKEPAPIKTDVKPAPVIQVVKKQEPVAIKQERQTMVNQKPQFSQTRSQNTLQVHLRNVSFCRLA